MALFGSAGRIDWWPAWAAVAVMVVWTPAIAIIVLYYSPVLLAERLGPRQGEKTWDAAIVPPMGLITLLRSIVAGLDQPYCWTGVASGSVATVMCENLSTSHQYE